MSILIKGLKMPSDTFVPIRIYNGVARVFRENGNIDCFEVIELPDHGDLIERDRLHHDLKADAIDKFALLDDTYLRYLEGLEKAEELLLGATVVIPAEKSEE